MSLLMKVFFTSLWHHCFICTDVSFSVGLFLMHGYILKATNSILGVQIQLCAGSNMGYGSTALEAAN